MPLVSWGLPSQNHHRPATCHHPHVTQLGLGRIVAECLFHLPPLRLMGVPGCSLQEVGRILQTPAWGRLLVLLHTSGSAACLPVMRAQGLREIRPALVRGVGFPGGTVVKSPPAKAGDAGSTPGSGRSPEGGSDGHSCILAWKFDRQRGWRTAVHGAAKSWMSNWACRKGELEPLSVRW